MQFVLFTAILHVSHLVEESKMEVLILMMGTNMVLHVWVWLLLQGSMLTASKLIFMGLHPMLRLLMFELEQTQGQVLLRIIYFLKNFMNLQ